MKAIQRIQAFQRMQKKSVGKQLIFTGLLLLFFSFLYQFNQFEKVNLVNTAGREFQKAVVIQIVEDNVQEDGSRTGQQKVALRMKTGPLKGEMVEATSTNGYLFGAACRPGMDVVVIESVSGDISIHSVYSADREKAVYGFLLIFMLCVCLVGGKKGFLACLGLIFTGICILYLYIPMIYRGGSPFVAAVIVAVLTTLVTMYLLNGWSRKTLSSVLGTVAGVVMAGFSAWLFGKAAGVGGYNVSNIESLVVLEDLKGIRVGELLFSGLLISSLGAVMDVAMSISSAVFEIHDQNESLSVSGLFWSGLRVGRDMMGTMVNTLILAFAGGAVSTLILNYAYQLPYLQIINSNNIDIEIMQGISGSIGIVLTVPFVSLVAAALAKLSFEKRTA